MLYATSSSLWAWVLGRAIVFGPSRQICCWQPSFHANTWYRLTPLHCLMPTYLLVFLPVLLSISQIPILLVSSISIQIVSTISLVSWHAFIPVFVIHSHSEYYIFLWCLLNLVMAIVAILINTHVCRAYNSIPVFFFLWLTIIQSQLLRTTIVHELPVSTRQPRIV